MAGELGLVGAIFGSMWVWLREHRDALAEAVQREAAVCQADAPRLERRNTLPGEPQTCAEPVVVRAGLHEVDGSLETISGAREASDRPEVPTSRVESITVGAVRRLPYAGGVPCGGTA
jgi:hypothetical protein